MSRTLVSPDYRAEAALAHMLAASDALSAGGSALLGKLGWWLRSATVQAHARLATQILEQ